MRKEQGNATVSLCFGRIDLDLFISQIVGKFTSIPCPARLAWIVNQDNPFFKNYRTASILNSLALQEGMQVLDFGCGAGRLTIPIAKAVGMLGKVTAADIQTAMLAIVQAKAEKEQWKILNIFTRQPARANWG
jgi:2-polyprenyl-3-methyl-5-hydroxy-6-metoxy-1,4-benzoquinol methylase